MIEEMIASKIKKTLQEDFPHLLTSCIKTARVTAAAKLGSYSYDDLTVTNKTEGKVFDAKIDGSWYEYSLKMLTRDGEIDEEFPEIPGVRSKVQIGVGGTAAVVLLYGELRPCIVGEVG